MHLILRICFALLILYYLLTPTQSELTKHFLEFLDDRFGAGFGERMERVDMGKYLLGSFGGKERENDTVQNQPVIFVHGVTLRAGVFTSHRNFFITKGYSSSELYATTYSDGGQTSFYMKEMNCADVKQIRNFIVAVFEYTKKRVNLIAYSMGVAISRKSILGGHCMDTGEFLGESLSSYIDTFVSVGGVAYGMEWCPKELPACNKNNGMVCTSEYMRNVNAELARYEGEHSFAIYSRDDSVIGQECCGHPCGELKNANLTIAMKYYDHVTVLTQTVPLQYELLTNHSGTAF